jgi:mRNA-degrading endonuclease RelE of RelBE toxin-antitoxin system
VTYRIEYTEDALEHLAKLTVRQANTVLDAVSVRLAHQPTVPTRNRKLLRANALAPWELRIGHLRIYYDVEDPPLAIVTIRAVGIKVRACVFIGGEEVEL